MPALLFTIAFAAEYPYSAVFYVGLYFSPLDLLFPLLVLILTSILSYMGSRILFESDVRRWKATSDQWLSGTKSEEEKQDHERGDNVAQLMNSLRVRRRDVETIVLLFVVVVPLTGMSYVSFRQSEWTVVVYESPAGGETIEIGVWYYNSFEGIEPGQNVDLAVGCQGEILAGGGTEANSTLNFQSREMTLAELQQMNETQFEDAFGRGWSNSHSSRTFSTGWQGPIHEEQYVWVLRFLNLGGRKEGTVLVSFRVMIIAI